MDVEAEKEWELETENMPMEVINSPHAQSHRMYDDKRKVTKLQTSLFELRSNFKLRYKLKYKPKYKLKYKLKYDKCHLVKEFAQSCQ